MSASWADLIAAAAPSIVLPVRPRGAVLEVPAPLRAIDVLELAPHAAIAVVADASGRRWALPCWRDGDVLRRAAAGDGVATLLLQRLSDSGAADGFTWTTYAHDAYESANSDAAERAIAVDQTNDSVIVGDAAVVKWAVQLPDVASPAPQRIRSLAAAGFAAMPAPWLLLEWRDAEDTVLIASVATYLPEALDGWDWAVADLTEVALHRAGLDTALDAPRIIGAHVAEMHAAFAASGTEKATPEWLTNWRTQADHDLAEALVLTTDGEHERLLSRAAAIGSVFAALADVSGTPLIDVHGDLHVGQVLRYGEPPEYAITDFDGNPVWSPAERGAKHPGALDVVGMLASFDHVARVVQHRVEGADVDIVRAYIARSQEEFLASYTSRLDERGLSHLFDERLLLPLRLQQECREFIYAARHLPHWKYVPDLALQDLLPSFH